MSDGFPDRGAPDEVPAAFGAWLHLSSGGAWDGDVERVADEQPE